MDVFQKKGRGFWKKSKGENLKLRKEKLASGVRKMEQRSKDLVHLKSNAEKSLKRKKLKFTSLLEDIDRNQK